MNQTAEKSRCDEIIRLLKTYKVNKTKIQLYQIELEGIESILKTEQTLVIEDENDCIEGMSLQAQKHNDMPRYQNNSFQSKTEKIALNHVPEMYWSIDRAQLIRRMRDIRSRSFRMNI